MVRKAALLFISATGLVLSSCASDKETAPPEDRSVSAIPWDRPEKWEGEGSIPGMNSGSN